MLPIPIPDGVAEHNGGRRVIYTPPSGDLTDDTIRACETLVIDDPPSISIMWALNDDDRLRAVNGLPLWLTIAGQSLPPTSLGFADPANPADMIDWRDMFRRYADLVGEEEGVDFLNRGDWSPAERAAIDDAVSDPIRWPDG